MGDKDKYQNIYDFFVERSKTSPLYRFIYLPQDPTIYDGIVKEQLANET